MWVAQSRRLWQLQALRGCSRPHYFLLSLFHSDTPHRNTKAAPLQEARMRDRFNLHAKGGDGGNGSTSIRRSRHERHGKPDGGLAASSSTSVPFSILDSFYFQMIQFLTGGNGGKGGDVILECSTAIWDFHGLQHHIHAGKGGHGTSKNKIGTRGSDKVVSVPVGTVIHLLQGEIPSVVETQTQTDLDPWELPGKLANDQSHSQSEEQSGTLSSNCTSTYDADNLSARAESVRKSEIIKQVAKSDLEQEDQIKYNVAELTEHGQRLVIARGGEGGLGNVCYPNLMIKPKLLKQGNSRDDGPDVVEPTDDPSSLRIGLPGFDVSLVLELKSIADVGLVGMPNAGKSTLLGAISRARPAVGHYAFTTLRPNLGNLNFEDFSITVADIPGLIKGAHQNRGLGHAFLRHVERTKVLAYVVDLAAALDGRKGIPPWEQLKDLILELEHHQEGLSDRPSLVVANKIDETGAEEVYKELEKRVHGVPMYPVCAVLGEGVAEVKDGLRLLMRDDQNLSRLSLQNIIVD